MVARVTQNIIAQRSLRDLNAQLLRLSNLQEQMSTGQRVNRPSDDPLDARRAIGLNLLLGKNEQYSSNMVNVEPTLEGTETALRNVVDILQRSHELAIQAANGTVDILSMQTIALEIDQLLEGMLVESNTRVNNRSVFSGTRTLQDAFSATRVGGEITAVNYDGNSNIIEVEIGDGVRIDANEPGDAAFQSTVDIFQTLIDLRDNMRAGDQNAVRTAGLPAIEDGLNQALFSVARVSSIQNRVDRVKSTTESQNVELQQQLSDTIDADFAETVLNMNVQQNSYQAALNATSRVIQPSLLDFIR
jgi:flagellar hook-associated protein 3 FlgL